MSARFPRVAAALFVGPILGVAACTWNVAIGDEVMDGGGSVRRDVVVPSIEAGRDAGRSDVAVPVDSGRPSSDSSSVDHSDAPVETPDVSAPPMCPAAEPTVGSACTDVGLECEYGTSTNVDCNTVDRCSSTGWRKVAGSAPCVTGTCPAAYSDITAGSVCTLSGEVCEYTQGTCTCGAPAGTVVTPDGGEPASSLRWSCTAEQPNCPSPRPKLGTACTDTTVTCDYAACTGGVELRCTAGVWEETSSACPASSTTDAGSAAMSDSGS